MHNLALALHDKGYKITGSDDEIYEPSKSRLKSAGILPNEFGWHPEKITKDIDHIILGMHAKSDNPELAEAKKLNIPIYSYPEYVAQESQNKKRVVIAGSHGKTTTTAMIMHVLSKLDIDYDYLVGAQLENFDRMVKISDAPLIILEGDEYLSSPIDSRPKMMHYEADIAVITGIAWDHINVFPTFDIYRDQFRKFINKMSSTAILYYYKFDKQLSNILSVNEHKCRSYSYEKIDNKKDKITIDGKEFRLNIIGEHNMQNLGAAHSICNELGISSLAFYENIQDFKGAAKRLQYRGQRGNYRVYQDFAHAPSKVKTTCDSVKNWFGDEKLYAFFELHTFSSLNKTFLPEYKFALKAADEAFVIYDKHTLKMKNMPMLEPEYVAEQFSHHNISVLTTNDKVESTVKSLPKDGNVLMMSSGIFGGLCWENIVD